MVADGGTGSRRGAPLTPSRRLNTNVCNDMTQLKQLLASAVITLMLLAAPGPMAGPAPASAQDPQSRLLATTIGGVAGMAAGGYLTVTVVVFEARLGRYIHDVDDILGWRAAPLLVGTVAGAGLGLYSPERLQGAVVFGAAGLGAGALIGLGIGSAVWEPPEGRWAGAAIGAGAGLVIGNVIGILNPLNLFTESDEATGIETTGVPIVFRIPL